MWLHAERALHIQCFRGLIQEVKKEVHCVFVDLEKRYYLVPEYDERMLGTVWDGGRWFTVANPKGSNQKMINRESSCCQGADHSLWLQMQLMHHQAIAHRFRKCFPTFALHRDCSPANQILLRWDWSIELKPQADYKPKPKCFWYLKSFLLPTESFYTAIKVHSH